jgi:hypothetical protein
VQLRAAFTWNGKDDALGREHLSSDEFPIEDEAGIVCDSCDTIWQVKDLTTHETPMFRLLAELDPYLNDEYPPFTDAAHALQGEALHVMARLRSAEVGLRKIYKLHAKAASAPSHSNDEVAFNFFNDMNELTSGGDLSAREWYFEWDKEKESR